LGVTLLFKIITKFKTKQQQGQAIRTRFYCFYKQ
jgi:hypothetical protein